MREQACGTEHAGRSTIGGMRFDDPDPSRLPPPQRPTALPPGFVPPRRPGSGAFSMAVLWLLIGGAVYLMVRAFVPGFQPLQVRAPRASEVLLSPDRSGNYTLPGSINGVPVTFLVDTGASAVSVSAAAARRMGLVGCQGMASQTANGRTTGCLALARELRFGPFSVRDVRVAVLPDMPAGTALLGMNLLSHLQMIQQGGRLLLRPDPD